MRRMVFLRKILLLVFLISCAQSIYAQQPPITPVIDKAMKAQLRNTYKLGVAAGNRPTVFAKVGDSITRTPYFLKDVGCNVAILGSHQRLAPTITYFRSTSFPQAYTTVWCGDSNSFTRDSMTAHNGWTVDEPLRKFSNPLSACPAPYDTPLRCELHLLKPTIALIMLGTNDLENNDTVNFRKKLTRIVQDTILDGVVPVLSTIPPRQDSPTHGQRVAPYNIIIREVAEVLQVPLWNYWLSLQGTGVINNGMDNRGIHPSVYNGGEPAVFTPSGLRYGMNLRNFTALDVLKKVKAVVQNNAPANASTAPNFTIFPEAPLAPVPRGTIVTQKWRIVRVNHTAPIAFALKSQPAGVSATFALSATGNYVTVTLTVRSGVNPGDQRFTIQGTSGHLLRTTTTQLIVN